MFSIPAEIQARQSASAQELCIRLESAVIALWFLMTSVDKRRCFLKVGFFFPFSFFLNQD